MEGEYLLAIASMIRGKKQNSRYKEMMKNRGGQRKRLPPFCAHTSLTIIIMAVNGVWGQVHERNRRFFSLVYLKHCSNLIQPVNGLDTVLYKFIVLYCLLHNICRFIGNVGYANRGFVDC